MLMRNSLILAILAFGFYACNSPQAHIYNKELVVESPAELKEKVHYPAINVDATARLIDNYFSKINRENHFNGAVLISRYGKLIYKKAYGYADFRTRKPLTVQSSFQLASVSKQFTAVAIMMLKEKGLLRYDDSIQRFFPKFPYHGITIRLLLNHRSGLCNYAYFCDPFFRKIPVNLDGKMVIDLMTKHHPRTYLPPNKHFDYSNTGYMILASIVEKVSKQSFSNYVNQHIFKPLQMTHSYVGMQDNGIEVYGYNSPGRRVVKDYLDEIYGDKGIYASVEDLYKWDEALYTDKLVKQESLKEAFTDGSPEQAAPFNYGFGWRIYTASNGDKTVFHAGWWKGFKTFFMRRLKDKTTVIILSNVANRSYKDIDELMDVVYDRQRTADSKFYQKILHTPE